jgi:low affinity Fe/Cu permease
VSEDATHPPSDVGPERSTFDNFADWATGIISHGPFFIATLVFVVVWAALGRFFRFSQGWTDVLSLPAAVLTVLMVALLDNEQRRSDTAVQRKLNVVMNALADFIEKTEVDRRHVEELRSAVGLSERESTPGSQG